MHDQNGTIIKGLLCCVFITITHGIQQIMTLHISSMVHVSEQWLQPKYGNNNYERNLIPRLSPHPEENNFLLGWGESLAGNEAKRTLHVLGKLQQLNLISPNSYPRGEKLGNSVFFKIDHGDSWDTLWTWHGGPFVATVKSRNTWKRLKEHLHLSWQTCKVLHTCLQMKI